MGLRQRYRQLPPSLFRRGRRDMMIGIAGAVISGVQAAARATRRIEPLTASDPWLALRVAGKQVVAHDQDVVALTLESVDGASLPRWHPGAHIDVRLPSGLLRQYSLCGDPAAGHRYRIAVRRIADGGGGSIEMHTLPTGATVMTQGPRNAFPLAVPGYGSPARRFRFIAGGIGITPILPMLRLAERRGVDWSMVYAGRHRDSLPFLDEVATYGERVRIRTDDVAGLPTAGELLGDCPGGTSVYACGPAPMLTAIRSALVCRDDVELHFERFAAAPVVDGTECSLRIASTGAEISVGKDETLLNALTRAGVQAPYSCQQGFCGTCRTRVLDGTVDHRDSLLTDPERMSGMMLVCVSRAADGSCLTLDL
jgi:ferredoxin-NADP reductase